MKQIANLDEKRLIIAYHKCNSDKSRKNIFCNNSIYNDWLKWWEYDCPHRRNGKPMQIYKGNIVVSAGKYRKGLNTEENFAFTKLLSSVSQWLYKNYNETVNRKSNQKMFGEKLAELREQHYCILENLLNNHLSDEYVLQDVSAPNLYRLREYTMVNKNTFEVIKGSYETILKRIENMIDNK